jgi:hypothetical protein
MMNKKNKKTWRKKNKKKEEEKIRKQKKQKKRKIKMLLGSFLLHLNLRELWRQVHTQSFPTMCNSITRTSFVSLDHPFATCTFHLSKCVCSISLPFQHLLSMAFSTSLGKSNGSLF